MANNQTKQIKTTVEAISSFDKMGIKDELLRSIHSFGCTEPTAIQQRVIVPFIQGKDLIAQVQPRSGITTAFSIGILQQIEVEKKICQAILLTPTREVALQTQEVIKNLSQYLDIDVFACVGGTSLRETIETLKQGVHIVVGTPGRVYYMIERGALDARFVKSVVFDDIDEMLSKEFKDFFYSIMNSLPTSVTMGISTTIMTEEINEISNKFMNDPVKFPEKFIMKTQEEMTLQGIKQFYIDVNKEDYKIETLIDLYQVISVNQSVIFCNSKERAEWIERKLSSHNYPVSIFHSEMDIEESNRLLTKFRQGSTRILIATDYLGKGIDIQQVSLVINLDMPESDENYVHRVSRPAGFGRKGVAINFITSEEMERINTLQEKYNTKIVPLPKTFMDYL